MTKQEQIKEIDKQSERRINYCVRIQEAFNYKGNYDHEDIPSILVDFEREIKNDILPKDSVVLSREEYEKLKSLYDTQKGAYITSSIGDLPLTVKGLRKAVDEITRLNRVETELQELNIKYYNEAKDLRRGLKRARKETAKEILDMLYDMGIDKEILECCRIYDVDGVSLVKQICEKYGVEIEE